MKELALITPESLVEVPTKAQVSEAVDRIYTMIAEEREADPLKALAVVTALADVFATAKKQLTEVAVKEAELYPEKTFTLGGATFQLKEAGVKYDYSDDDKWQRLKEKVDAATAELKGREKTLFDKGMYAKYSTTTVSVTLPKA